jgi:hypothetical protein
LDLCSVKDLESEPGLFVTNKEVRGAQMILLTSDSTAFSLDAFWCSCVIRHNSLVYFPQKVFSEAEEMARRCREQMAETPRAGEAEDSCNPVVPFDNEAQSYANWKWLKFSKSDEVQNGKSRAES